MGPTGAGAACASTSAGERAEVMSSGPGSAPAGPDGRMVASASASGAFSPLFGEAEAHAEAEASEMAAAFDGMGVADVGAVGESGTVAWDAAGGGAPAL